MRLWGKKMTTNTNIIRGLTSGEPKAFLEAVNVAVFAYNQNINGSATPWLVQSAKMPARKPDNNSGREHS